MIFGKENYSAIDLSEVRHIERIKIGSLNPLTGDEEDNHQLKMDKINKLLNGSPKGMLIGKDLSVKVIRIGEHTVMCQQICYHIGFKRKPPSL